MKHVRWTNTHKHTTFLLYSTFSWFRQKVRLLVFIWEDYIGLPLSVSESSGLKCQSRREAGTEREGWTDLQAAHFLLHSHEAKTMWGEVEKHRWRGNIHPCRLKENRRTKKEWEKKTGEVMWGKQYPLMKYKCRHTHFNHSNRADICPREDYG